MTDCKCSESLWSNSLTMKSWPALRGAESCEVLVIGAGMAGVLTARNLQKEGVDVVLVDGFRVGRGVTAGTTAKITSQHGLIYHKIAKEKGLEAARSYLHVQEKAINDFADLARSYSCSFQRRSSFVYSRRGRAALEAELKTLEEIGFAARYSDAEELPFHTDGAVEFPLQASFHPLQFLKLITEDMAGGENTNPVRIYENTRITGLKRWRDGGWQADFDQGMILADQVVIATHFPFLDRRGMFFLKMYQSKACVIAGSTGQPPLCGMYVDEDDKGLSFRQENDMLILAGGNSRTGKGREHWKDLEEKAVQFYPEWKTVWRWTAQDCISLDHMPYIGPYCSGWPGLWTAAGFNKWGMTGSMAASRILADRITGRDNPYAHLFLPDRPILKPQLFINSLEAAWNLLRPCVPRCRHLGCSLTWNEAEHTWECSCHGSRYTEEGRCIEGPSVKDIFG